MQTSEFMANLGRAILSTLIGPSLWPYTPELRIPSSAPYSHRDIAASLNFFTPQGTNFYWLVTSMTNMTPYDTSTPHRDTMH